MGLEEDFLGEAALGIGLSAKGGGFPWSVGGKDGADLCLEDCCSKGPLSSTLDC